MAQADPTNIVTDPFLISILQTSSTALAASLNLLRQRAHSTHFTQTTNDDHEHMRAHKTLLSHVSRLRGQNRDLARTVRDIKAHTAASKSEVDTLHLSLQNLYYESRHLAGEIAACEDFPHKYMVLPMVPEAEFIESNPGWTEDKQIANDRELEDALMEARIGKEYQDRLAMEEERKKLVAKKAEMMKENARRKEKLARLDAEMEKFVGHAEPISGMFGEEM